MKTATRSFSICACFPALLITLACLLSAPQARAGLTLNLHLYRDSYGYFFYPDLSTNATAPAYPTGVYLIASPQYPASGAWELYQATTTNFNECYNNSCGSSSYYPTFDLLMNAVTNGQWTVSVTNSTFTNTYYFNVADSTLTSNIFSAPVLPVYPVQGENYVPNNPLFQWTGPVGWTGNVNAQDQAVSLSYGQSQALPPGTTSWSPTYPLANGTNEFSVDYTNSVTGDMSIGVPTNSAGQAISGWVATTELETHFNQNVLFNVAQMTNDYSGFLVARYDFETTNDPGYDSSGNDNYSDCSSSDGGETDIPSTDAAVGSTYARQYFGETDFCFEPGYFAYNDLSNALSGNFTVTAWVNTTNTLNSPGANAYYGAPIFFAGADYNNHCAIPMSLTGGKVAFSVISSDGPGTVTLDSTTSVNDGQYHFLAVTRQQATGLMSIYVDGVLEATNTGITAPIITQGFISIAGGYYYYAGLLDDVRLYSTNLSSADVVNLESGGIVPTLAVAAGAANLPMTTSGDTDWFVESTNTDNGDLYADQSGPLTGSQTSTLSAIVNGPGTLTFNWASQDSNPDGNMDYEFYYDNPGNDIGDLYGSNVWQSIEDQNGGPVQIPAGQHTLYWTVYDYGDTNLAGFVDDVVYTTPDTNPVSANVTFTINRIEDPVAGEYYDLFPTINSISPLADSGGSDYLQSPSEDFSVTDGGYSSSTEFDSIPSLVNECTNGLWSLYINYGLPNQRLFQFSMTLTNLTTNLLSAVKITNPTNGASGFPSGGTIQWVGPANWSTLGVSKQNIDGTAYVGAGLAVSSTSWNPGGLIPGTNRCDIDYTSNNFPGFSCTIPVDTSDVQTASSFVTQLNLGSDAASIFLVSSGPSATILVNPQAGGGNFQVSFLSQSGFTNYILWKTNLASANWLTYTNVAGNGSVETVPIPLAIFGSSRQGFIRVLTQ